MGGPRLDLVAPGLLGPVPATVSRAIGEVGELRALRELLSRGRQCRCDVGTPDSLVGQLLGDSDPGVAGPLLAGLLEDEVDGYVAAAGGCHLIADRDRLMVQAGPDHQLGRDEAESIAASFNDAFGSDGWQLYARDGALVLVSEQALPASLVPLTELSGHYLDDFLPSGPDAREWRALLNELQMMLFEHPVNEARQRNGIAPVNGLWFWGCGEPVRGLPRIAHCVATSDGVLRGMATLGGAQVRDPVERLSQLDPAMGDTLAYWAEGAQALATGDAMAWMSALARFEEQWASELLAGLKNGSWASVRLHVGPGRYWYVTPGHLRRFWRRIAPLKRHLDVPAGEG